jgi:beta-1,4-mannooligosaccharide/beta-1,4-mannosyl-N-acetylglucosamine phosphorylase
MPLTRHPDNPILTPEQVGPHCSAVFNCGAVEHDGQVVLMLRVEDDRRQSSFRTARSDDGVHFVVADEPINYPQRPTEQDWGGHRFDMRLTPMDGGYYAMHAVWLQGLGCGIGIARTQDLQHFEPVGPVSVPSNRNGVLLPEQIGGRYCRLERPQDVDGSGTMWVGYSPDLIHWGDARPLKMPTLAWGTRKTGAGAVPIRTDHGWLTIYHATALTASTENYYLGAMLLDLDDPSRIVAAPDRFVLQPEKLYECVGQVPNVVFTAGAVQRPDGQLYIYYGGADTRICLAQTTIDQLVQFCLSG